MEIRPLAGNAIIALVATAALTGCTGQAEPTPTTTPPTDPVTTLQTTPSQTDPATDEPTTEASEPFDPFTGEPAPQLPMSFGNWGTDEVRGDGVATYAEATTAAEFTAFVHVFITKEEAQADVPSTAVGEFLCGEFPDEPGRFSCSTNAWNGALQITSSDLTAEELGAAGAELSAAWQ